MKFALCCSLVLSFVPALASPANPANLLQQEYFVRQEANEALLIRINAFEAEIDSDVFAPERKLLLSSAMPQSRLVPIFQFISATPKPRQLDIEVSSSLRTANSKIGIEIIRLSAWDERSATLIRAYSLLSFGMQVSKVNTAADWTVKINSLMSAGDTFKQFGMQELHLWSAYLAAHLVQYRLGDYNMVLALSREILADTNRSRWRDIELATLELRSAALIGLRGSGALQVSPSDPDPVQAALLTVANRADSMGYYFEKAQAIQQSALAYENQGLYPKALEQFQLALQIANSIGDDELATGIRESIVQMHAGQGNDPATNKVLQEIETHLVADGGGDELASNLLQQGRIFIRSYRYQQAIEVLLQALEFENDSSIRTQLNLVLAQAHFETGQSTETQAYLRAAGLSAQQAQNYFPQSGQDASSSRFATRAFTQSLYQRARALDRGGQAGKAVAVMQQLIDEILFWRLSVPGVLGAWYWQRQEQLFAYYLDLKARAPGSSQRGGLDTLLVLTKLRYAVKSRADMVGADTLRALLAQRANATGDDQPADLNARIKTEQATVRALLKVQYGFLSKTGLQNYLGSLGRNEAVLTYHITKSAAYAWVGKNGRVQQRKLANPSRLYADLQDARNNMRVNRGQSLERLLNRLGKQLFAPVADLLAEQVYLIPAGPLLGLPFDALRVNGRYLAEDHRVVNLLSFPANPDPAASLRVSLRTGTPQKIFLAGHPQDFSGGFATHLQTSVEIQAVTDIFRGPGLHIIQGAALLPDEFHSDRFANADVAHLTMPASIDLGHPERSALELSEALRGLGRTPFRQADIEGLKLTASLVFLSSSQTVGRPRSAMATQAGVASAFLDAGADAVVASLWVKQKKAGETPVVDSLVTAFYRNLDASGDIASALTATKRQYLQKHRGGKSLEWARFQVFVD